MYVLHKQRGQLGLRLLMLFLKYGKELGFCGIKAQIFREKRDIISVLHLAVFRFVAYNSFCIPKS